MQNRQVDELLTFCLSELLYIENSFPHDISEMITGIIDTITLVKSRYKNSNDTEIDYLDLVSVKHKIKYLKNHYSEIIDTVPSIDKVLKALNDVVNSSPTFLPYHCRHLLIALQISNPKVYSRLNKGMNNKIELIRQKRFDKVAYTFIDYLMSTESFLKTVS